MHVATRCAVRFAFVFLALLSAAISQSGAAVSPFALLHGFKGAPSEGSNPQFNANLATDGTSFYGVTFNGGISNNGVLFKMNVSGSGYQNLHSFTGIFVGGGNLNDGAHPEGTPLLIGSTLYGTTSSGGTNKFGSVYKINTDGSNFQLIHSFGTGSGSPNDGYFPLCTLVTDGTNLFGITSSSSFPTANLGAIFKMGTNGDGYTLLYKFGAVINDGANPQGSLTLSGGILYGMTRDGGSLSSGTLFAIGTDGSNFHVIHTFTGVVTDGSKPYGTVTVSNTTLYGMTSAGGAIGAGCVFSVDTSGTGFTLLHSFATTEGWSPFGEVTFFNSKLYGMTRNGGTNNGIGLGTIFHVNTDGSGYQIDHTFFFGNPSNLSDGSTPYASLTALGSSLYGMTYFGGSASNAGEVFSFTPTAGGGGGGSPAAGLKVNILPSAAVKAGAQWALNGGSFMNSGTLVGNAGAGAHVISYKAVTGWIAPAPQIIDLTVGITNTVTATYTAADTTKPTLKVVSPTTKTIVTTSLFTATGTASDNVGVALVFYQLNGGAWIAAATLSNWTNWTAANLTLTPGVNTMKFYAKDLSGNVSPTNTVSFTFVVTAPIVVSLNPPGGGTIKPNLNGQSLQIGKPFSMAVKATKGFSFLNWTGGTNTTSPKITFVMVSNLTFTANFKDNTRPVNVILTPTKNQVVSNAAPVATGRAMDNVGVAAVNYQVNGGAWTPADLTDGTNWHTATLTLSSGANTISAYAVDAAGNISLTNTIAFSYAPPPSTDWAPDSLNGLLASVTPDNGSPESVSFGASTFAQASAGSADPQNYGGGGYTYLKVDTNHAQLSLTLTMPAPAGSNSVGPIDLIFTSHNAGHFTNETSGDTGGISLSSVSGLVPSSFVGKTITAVSTNNNKTITIKLTSATAYKKSPANNSNTGSSTGSYTYSQLSPVSGIFAFVLTGEAKTAYIQLSFTSTTAGTYITLIYDDLGVLQDSDIGHFTL